MFVESTIKCFSDKKQNGGATRIVSDIAKEIAKNYQYYNQLNAQIDTLKLKRKLSRCIKRKLKKINADEVAHNLLVELIEDFCDDIIEDSPDNSITEQQLDFLEKLPIMTSNIILSLIKEQKVSPITVVQKKNVVWGDG